MATTAYSNQDGQTANDILQDPVEFVEAVEQGLERDSGGSYYPVRVSGSVVTNESVAKVLQVPPISAQTDDNIARAGKKGVAKVSIDEQVLGSGITQPLGVYQRAVLEAALSEVVAGNSRFTASMLFRTMTGKTHSEAVSPGQQAEIDEAMSQLMYTPLHIDLSAYSSGEVSKATLDGPILPAERVTMTVSGVPCTAYSILSMPIILRFCALTQGMNMTPLGLLDVNLRFTPRTISILNILQRKVAPILYPVGKKYNKNSPPIHVMYSEFYDEVLSKETFSPKSEKTLRLRVRESVHTILNDWIDGGYIRKWEDIPIGRSKAVEIFFPLSDPPPMPTIYNSLPWHEE